MNGDQKQYYNPSGSSNKRLYLVLGAIGLLVLASFGAGMVLGTPDVFAGGDGEQLNYGDLYTDSKDGVVGIMVVTEEGKSTGSGFVYDDSGHVVTNAHVVANAEEIHLQYSTGDWVEANIIGADVDTDLAVLRPAETPASATKLDVAESNPERGEPVMVLGSPLELDESVSHGIVTGVGRELRRSNGFVIPDIVQTDAPVNAGNSGSPVVKGDGEVVGVVSARQGDNIGFAVSAEMVNVIVPQLVEDGSVNHSYVGIRTIQNDPVVADGNDYNISHGMAVVEVVDGSPADGVLQGPEESGSVTTESGMSVSKAGDVIVGVDGQEVRTGEEFSAYLMKSASPGDTVTITVVRNGSPVDVELTLGDRPE